MRKIVLSFIVVFTLLCLMNSTTSAKSKSLDYLFKSGENGYNTFRIPALVVTNEGTVLAFAEGRKNGSSDTGDIDIVLKRSTDNHV